MTKYLITGVSLNEYDVISDPAGSFRRRVFLEDEMRGGRHGQTSPLIAN